MFAPLFGSNPKKVGTGKEAPPTLSSTLYSVGWFPLVVACYCRISKLIIRHHPDGFRLRMNTSQEQQPTFCTVLCVKAVKSCACVLPRRLGLLKTSNPTNNRVPCGSFLKHDRTTRNPTDLRPLKSTRKIFPPFASHPWHQSCLPK